MSFEQAATIPVAFSTVDYAFDLARLKKGETILIHAAAGGVGVYILFFFLASFVLITCRFGSNSNVQVDWSRSLCNSGK